MQKRFPSNRPGKPGFLPTLTSVAVALLVSHTALASSHREAPGIAGSPRVDGTDFYAFASYEPGRDDYVTLIANYVPLQDAYGGPNYFTLDESALYEIHIDNDADAVEDLTFQFRFTNELAGATVPVGDAMVQVPLKAIGPITDGDSATANFAESYTLSMVSGDRRSGTRTAVTGLGGGATSFRKPADYAGEKTFGDAAAYTAYATNLSNSGSIYNEVEISACPEGAQNARVFVGQRKDSFAVNLGRIFDLVNLDPIGGTDADGTDDLADKNVTTLAIEVHKDCLAGTGGGIIGAWTTASKRQVSIQNPAPEFGGETLEGGAWTQVSRLGAPLVNEVVIGLGDKDRFNASEPSEDGQFATYVTNPTLPFLINALFNSDGGLNPDGSIAPSNLPRTDLVAAFLTGIAGVNMPENVVTSEMLRLNTGVAATAADAQSNLGVAAGDLAGFPNGRRPGDDVVDLALRVVMGALCHPVAVDLDASGTAGDAGDNLGFCEPADAPAGTAPLNDNVAQNAGQFDTTFPYLTAPLPGASN